METISELHETIQSKILELEAQLEASDAEVQKLTDLVNQRRQLQIQLREARITLTEIQKQVPSLDPAESAKDSIK